MITLAKLRQQAINAAKNSNWDQAVETNQQILEQTPQDVTALNRLGLAYLQLGDSKKAKQSFQESIKIDKTNTIAKKQLERITSKQTAPAPSFHREYERLRVLFQCAATSDTQSWKTIPAPRAVHAQDGAPCWPP